MFHYFSLYVVVIVLLLISTTVISEVQEAEDGSVCFNNCNGHGKCIDYSCHCYTGYHGDDCSTTFIIGDNVVPILSIGDYNVTKKNFTTTLTKNKMVLVGFSSYNCHRCIQAEYEYLNISIALKTMKIPFVRADTDKLKSYAIEYGVSELPSLVLFSKLRPLPYRGVHTTESVLTFIQKQIDKPVITLKSVTDVESFINSRDSSKYSLSTVLVVGFFSEHEDIEEDDYEEFVEVAKDLQPNEDIFMAVVTNPKTSEWFKKNKTIDRTPSMLMIGEGEKHTINIDELFGDGDGIKQWIIKNSIPLVGKMTPQNFPLYEKLGIPMLLLFIDLTDELLTSEPGKIIGGKSGGILNELLLVEYRAAAAEHRNRIAFVYLDGTVHQDQMKSLGLYGGKERLPLMAFNTRDGSKIPFPEELPINVDTILQYCADFISGKLRSEADSAEMAKKALQAARPINPKNKAQRKERKQAPEVVRGISEQFGDGNAGDDSVVTVTPENFDEVVLNEDKDVVLLLHAKECESCSHFAVYFKRMALRFRDLGIDSLEIARMDVSDDSPPAHLNLMIGPLPLLLMIPASAKYPPWTFYSGLGKVQPMMKWVQQMASIPFEMPNLPHLTEQDRVAYKTQVREREEALDKKREEERLAMEQEEREKEELKARKGKGNSYEDGSKTTETMKEVREMGFQHREEDHYIDDEL